MKGRKMKKFLGLTIAAMLVSAPIFAADKTEESGYKDYLAMQFVRGKLGYGIDSNGMAIKYGKRFSENFGMVSSVAFLRGHESSTIGENKLYNSFDGLTASIGPSWYITDDFSVYGTVGLMKYSDKNSSHTNSRTKVIGKMPTPRGLVNLYGWDDEASKKIDDTTVIYGIGINYHFFESMVLNASFERFNGNYSVMRKNHSYKADVISIGFGFQF